jgi:flagellar basal body-associated protein FliL
MSDEAPAEATERAPGAKTPKAVVGLLAANLLLSAGILVKVLGSSANVATAHAASEKGEDAKPKTKEIVGPLATLEPFVVNLDEAGTPRYLKVQVELEMKDGAAVRVVEKNKTLVRDAILAYLSGLKLGETLGAASKDQIRDALAELIAEIIGADRVRRVVFAEFVVQ